MIDRVAALAGCVAVTLAGCTSTGTSFGLPRAVLGGPAYKDAAEAVQDLTTRNNAYKQAAQGAANGAQMFDLPAILGGVLGIASVAFEGVTEDMRPTAGTLAAGAMGLRGYYSTGGRQGAYVAGARSTACLLALATKLEAAGLTKDALGEWRTMGLAARAGSTAEEAAFAVAAGAVAAAPQKLATAAIRVDTEVMRKLKSPEAPDFSAFMRNYQAASQRAAQDKPSLVGTKAMLAPAKANRVNAFARGATVSLSDQLLDAVADLDPDIEQCVAYAA